MTRSHEVRPAATVVLVRDSAARGELQVLLLKRADSRDHTSGAWVFPGGVVDQDDARAQARCDVADDAASARLGLPHGGSAFYAAAMRECFEECGVTLAASRFAYIAHWLTPHGRPKRFDTRFFLAEMPQRQRVIVDGREILAHAWVSPADALGGWLAPHLLTPTRSTMQALREFRSVDDAKRWAASLESIACIQPRLALGLAGVCSITEAHPAFHEVQKLDPNGSGNAWCEFQPGAPVQLGARTIRVTDASGRNRYRVRTETDAWEDVREDEVRLVAEDRIVIAPAGAELPSHFGECADWMAPAHGFLVRLG